MEPQRALLASAVGVVCRISRLICRLTIGIEQQDLVEELVECYAASFAKSPGKSLGLHLFCTSVWDRI
jgi:hypothetical protein